MRPCFLQYSFVRGQLGQWKIHWVMKSTTYSTEEAAGISTKGIREMKSKSGVIIGGLFAGTVTVEGRLQIKNVSVFILAYSRY